MLKPIPTAHPAIMLGSLAILCGLVFYNLHSGLQKPHAMISLMISLMVVFACMSSQRRRAKAIREKYSHDRRRGDRL